MEPGTVVAQRFEIERRVSVGGMSAVYRARDLRTGGVVAVKVLHRYDGEEHRDRLLREADVLARLRHPGVVRYVAHGGATAAPPYLVMEWVEGETLGKRLARAGLTINESVGIALRLAETLAAVHGKGIIHRDIKPGNVMLRDSDVANPTLIDFGVARIGSTASEITNTGIILGTLGYMAPEQARGDRHLDARADVFALGAVLFKCVTGQAAFPGDDEIGILAKMHLEPPRAGALCGDVPPALEDLLARMLSRDPLQRPARIGLVAAELVAMGAARSIELRAENPGHSIAFYRRAAARALEANDLEACIEIADRGIACGAEGEERGRLLLRKAEAHRWRGEHEEARESARSSVELLPRSERRWYLAAGETIEACASLGLDGELHRAVDELCEKSSGTLAAPHLVALARAACVFMAAGNYPAADELLRLVDPAYEHARRLDDDPLAAAYVYRTRAYRALVSGDTGSALSMYNVAITHFEAAGDVRAACLHLASAAGACIELGSYGEAERALDDALVSAEAMGLSAVSARGWHHQGILLARTGDPSAAIGRADRAIDAFVAQGDRRMEMSARLHRASFSLLADEVDRAERDVTLVLEHPRSTPPLRAYGLAILASTQLRSGRSRRAERAARDAIQLLESLGGVEQGEATIRLVYAEALAAIGDEEGAREAIATARVRILERTAMIQDVQWKDTFIDGVRENVRTLELARAWRVGT